MIDKNNGVEYSGIRIKHNHIKDVQNLIKDYPTIRFLSNPEYYPNFKYFRISFEGDVKECGRFANEIQEAGWEWKIEEPKKTFWQKLFGV